MQSHPVSTPVDAPISKQALLFTPGAISPLTLNNRAIMAQMTTRTAD